MRDKTCYSYQKCVDPAEWASRFGYTPSRYGKYDIVTVNKVRLPWQICASHPRGGGSTLRRTSGASLRRADELAAEGRPPHRSGGTTNELKKLDEATFAVKGVKVPPATRGPRISST